MNQQMPILAYRINTYPIAVESLQSPSHPEAGMTRLRYSPHVLALWVSLFCSEGILILAEAPWHHLLTANLQAWNTVWLQWPSYLYSAPSS